MITGDAKLQYWRDRYQRIKKDLEANLPVDPLETLTDTEAAYLAGIVDGEGSITIGVSNGRKCYQPGVHIIMCDKPVLEWMAKRLGVTCGIIKRSVNERHRTQYGVRLLGRRAAWLCIAILPWLRVKKKQAELVIAFSKTYKSGYDGAGIDPKVNKLRKTLKRDMHRLNSPNGYKGRHKFVYI